MNRLLPPATPKLSGPGNRLPPIEAESTDHVFWSWLDSICVLFCKSVFIDGLPLPSHSNPFFLHYRR